MGGNCDEAVPCGRVSWFGRGLARYFLISLVVHSASFILYEGGTWFPAITAGADPVGRIARLEVHLAPRGETVVVTAAPVERQVAVRTIGKPKGGGLPHVPNDAAPELVSEVDMEIHDFRVTGFMILALEVDDQGVPGNAEVIYSDLPAETIELLAKRFAAARFKPAVKGGQVTAASILMRIDVE